MSRHNQKRDRRKGSGKMIPVNAIRKAAKNGMDDRHIAKRFGLKPGEVREILRDSDD